MPGTTATPPARPWRGPPSAAAPRAPFLGAAEGRARRIEAAAPDRLRELLCTPPRPATPARPTPETEVTA